MIMLKNIWFHRLRFISFILMSKQCFVYVFPIISRCRNHTSFPGFNHLMLTFFVRAKTPPTCGKQVRKDSTVQYHLSLSQIPQPFVTAWWTQSCISWLCLKMCVAGVISRAQIEIQPGKKWIENNDEFTKVPSRNRV